MSCHSLFVKFYSVIKIVGFTYMIITFPELSLRLSLLLLPPALDLRPPEENARLLAVVFLDGLAFGASFTAAVSKQSAEGDLAGLVCILSKRLLSFCDLCPIEFSVNFF